MALAHHCNARVLIPARGPLNVIALFPGASGVEEPARAEKLLTEVVSFQKNHKVPIREAFHSLEISPKMQFPGGDFPQTLQNDFVLLK